MREQFKLTDEMIQQIEEKVNKGLEDVDNGMKERCAAAGCHSAFFAVCWITIDVDDSKVQVIEPIKSYDDDDEDGEDFSDF